MFISNPNLPENRVKSVIIDYRAQKTANALKKFGINVYFTPKLKVAYPAVSGHADMLFHQLDYYRAAVPPSATDYFKNIFQECEILSGNEIADTYPKDAAYNVLRIGNKAFHKKESTEAIIYEYFQNNGIKLINTNQGYSKCSVCIVSEKAIITSDRKIAMLAKDNNIDSLLINCGHIVLKDFPYGFIGGASGLISKEILAFNGCIENHPDYDIIKKFCFKHNVEPVSLHDEILEDIGSIIPIE